MTMETVATPKQIRELMKVDGLTNDEVKSHLQVKIKSLFVFENCFFFLKNKKHRLAFSTFFFYV